LDAQRRSQSGNQRGVDQLRQRQLEQQRIQQQQQQKDYRSPQSGQYTRGIDQLRNREIWQRSQQQQIQRERLQQYNSRWNNWDRLRDQRERELRNERRNSYLRYQQRYWERLREDRLRLERARYYDSIVNNYRYYRGGSYYYTSSYGAQMLRDALNSGYEQGFEAGLADRQDGWRFDYENAYAYQDGSFGYNSYYVGLDEYSYYFREGFQRGYEDGYYSRYQYGRYSNGRYSILGSVIGSILDFVTD